MEKNVFLKLPALPICIKGDEQIQQNLHPPKSSLVSPNGFPYTEDSLQ